MRNSIFALLAALTLSAASGCCGTHWWGHHACNQCGEEGCGSCGGNGGACGPGGCPSGYCPGNSGPGGCGAGGCANGGCAAGACAADGGPARWGRNIQSCPVPDCYTDQRAVDAQLGGPPGPPSGQITYPYYTVRGPRDFFANHPPTIGP
ncbi:MAG TPA: hypothetical protein VGJ15_02680 [Pirellulales bacterium]